MTSLLVFLNVSKPNNQKPAHRAVHTAESNYNHRGAMLYSRGLTRGKRYASVFPEPVCEASKRSPPLSISGTAAVCMKRGIC